MKYRMCTCNTKQEVLKGVDYCQNCGDFIGDIPIQNDIKTPETKSKVTPGPVTKSEEKETPKPPAKKKSIKKKPSLKKKKGSK